MKILVDFKRVTENDTLESYILLMSVSDHELVLSWLRDDCGMPTGPGVPGVIVKDLCCAVLCDLCCVICAVLVRFIDMYKSLDKTVNLKYVVQNWPG